MVVGSARVGAATQQSVNSRGAAIANGSMQRRDTALGPRVGVRAGIDQVVDHRLLPAGIPVRGARPTANGRMQRLGTMPVAGADVRPTLDEILGDVDVIRERRDVQCGVARVAMRLARGDEEFLAARQRCRRQERRRLERCAHRGVIMQGDRDEHRRYPARTGHTTPLLAASPAGKCLARLGARLRAIVPTIGQVEDKRSGLPFAIKATVVCGVPIAIVIALLLNQDQPSRGHTRSDDIVEQISIIGLALTPRDSTNLELKPLVAAGQAGSAQALSLTSSLESADQTSIDQLAGVSWLPEAQAAATDLISAIAAQLTMLKSAGDSPAAVDDTRIAASTGVLWRILHPGG